MLINHLKNRAPPSSNEFVRADHSVRETDHHYQLGVAAFRDDDHHWVRRVPGANSLRPSTSGHVLGLRAHRRLVRAQWFHPINQWYAQLRICNPSRGIFLYAFRPLSSQRD